jgi:single-strand DNA-binding protein
MADTHVTITGNLTDDPELRFTPAGTAVANFRLAVTARVRDGETWRDGDTSFFRVNVWRQLAEHAADSLSKGDRAVVIGRLRSRSWETPKANDAAWSRSRPTRSPPACDGRSPSPTAPTAARAATTSRRPGAPAGEAGAEATRPGLAHPKEMVPDAPVTLPHPPAAGAGPAPAGRTVGGLLPHLRVPARQRQKPSPLRTPGRPPDLPRLP